jgi:hypothetical protein
VGNAGGRAPTVGALGNAGAVAEDAEKSNIKLRVLGNTKTIGTFILQLSIFLAASLKPICL